MFRELGRAEKELFLNERIRQLKMLYQGVRIKLEKSLSQITLTGFQRYRTEAVLKQVRSIVKILDKEAVAWTKKNIPLAYSKGVDIAGTRLKIMGVTDKVAWDAQIHTSAVNTLTDAVAADLLIANGTIKKQVTGYIRKTQQVLLQDKAITKMIAEGTITGEARTAISTTMLNEFRKKIGRGGFIVINGRNYRPEAYAELVARTRMAEASTQGVINTSLQYGEDLVQWSVHADSCEICQQLQGRIFSISGNDSEFPALNERPPAHPNCECALLPVNRETLQRRMGSNYKNIVDLSNSKIPIHSHKQYEQELRGYAL